MTENSRSTAIIVIHGIGEQNPFETLDSFTRGYADYLNGNEIKPTLSHCLAPRKRKDGSAWTESFVRFELADNRCIDVHEFFWAYLTEEKIGLTEIWQWVGQAISGAKEFYKEYDDKERLDSRSGKIRFLGGSRRYWHRLRRIMVWASIFYFASSTLLLPILALSKLWQFAFLNRWVKRINRFASRYITGYIGDIAIYTTMDEKTSRFKLRQQILGECQTLVESVLDYGDGQARYDNVIIAGHSLGSVIAFDTLNRLNIEANTTPGFDQRLEKLTGLITFGSPLDKVAFFFFQHASKEQHVRRQIMGHLHSFKAIKQKGHTVGLGVEGGPEPKLDRMPWYNYYDDKDPISGHLDFYDISAFDETTKQCDDPKGCNVRLELHNERGARCKWGAAHGGYWTDPEFYKDIDRRLLKVAKPNAKGAN